MADPFDNIAEQLANLTSLLSQNLAGASGAGQPPILSGRGGGASGGSGGGGKGSRGARREPYDYSLRQVRSIFKNLGVRNMPVTKQEQAELGSWLRQIKSQQGRDELAKYTTVGNTFQERWTGMRQFISEIKQYEPGRLNYEMQAYPTDLNFSETSPGAGARTLSDYFQTTLHSLPHYMATPTARKQRLFEINRMARRDDFEGLQRLYQATRHSPNDIMGYSSQDIAALATPPSKRRGQYGEMDTSHLEALVQGNGNIHAGRELFSRNIAGNADADFFNKVAGKVKSIYGMGFLEQQIQNGITADDFQKDPSLSRQLRSIDRVAARQQAMSLPEQFASYFNYMTTQGMRRGGFRFLAQEAVPALGHIMAHPEGILAGLKALPNAPLLALAAAGTMAGVGVEASNLAALASLTGYATAGTPAGLGLFTKSFMLGQSSETLLGSIRALSLTQGPNSSTFGRATLTGQIMNATGLSQHDVTSRLNRLGALGASDRTQQMFGYAMAGGIGAANPAQAAYVSDFYSQLNMVPSPNRFLKTSTLLAANPIMQSLMPSVANIMANPMLAYQVGAMTGRDPDKLMQSPSEMLGAFKDLVGKGGTFDYGDPALTSIVADQFLGLPQGLTHMIASGQYDQLFSQAQNKLNITPEEARHASIMSRTTAQQAAIAGNKNPLSRLFNKLTGNDEPDIEKFLRSQPGAADPTGGGKWSPGALDVHTGLPLVSETMDQKIASAVALGFKETDVSLGGGSNEQVYWLQRIASNTENISSNAVPLDHQQNAGTTGSGVVSGPPAVSTPTPTRR